VAMVPLLIAKGAGAASRFNIGLVIAAGMTIGTLFTLFVTPAVYTFLAKDYRKARARAVARGHFEGAVAAEEVEAKPAMEAQPASAMAEGEAEAVPANAADREASRSAIDASGEAEEQDWRRTAEVLAFSSAAQAATSEDSNKGRKGAKRPPKRKPLTPAAE
jgi:AcrB/AcrD/AcrF family